nr:uncharacterized protein CTRU02_12197 [Colletotrichum truncatum]KAF6784986.1 hypothetical protein CTRU02_12197 [Colletotrichum truncatum]
MYLDLDLDLALRRRDSYDRDDKKSSGGGFLGGILGGGSSSSSNDKKDKKSEGFTDKIIDGAAEYAKKKW